MKRPLFVLMIGLVLGELSGHLLYWKGLILPASLMALILFRRDRWPKWKPFFILFCLILLGIISGIFRFNMERIHIAKTDQLAKDLEGTECILSGKILRKKETSGDYEIYILKNPCFDQGKKRRKCKGHLALMKEKNEMEAKPGDFLKIRASIRPLCPIRNPGEFDDRNYQLSNGIYMKAYGNQVLSLKRPRISILGLADSLKEKIENEYSKYLKEEDKAMLSAMVLGEKSELTDDRKRIYRENGMAHLLAISGLHMSIVGGAVYRFLRKRNISYGISCLCGSFLLLFYGCMTGFAPSVVRACIMYLIYLLAEYSGMSYDLISSMSLACIFMILEAPRRIFDGGFLVSYSCLIAIGLVIPLVHEKRNRSEKRKGWETYFHKLYEGIIDSSIIFLVSLPFILHFYYQCSPYSIFINPLVLPAMPILMLDAILAGTCGLFIGLPIWRYAYLPAIIIIRVYDNLFHLLHNIPGACLITGCMPIWEMVLFYLLEILIFFFWIKDLLNWKTLFFFLSIFLMIQMGREWYGRNKLRITMLDVGQGDCILLQLPGGCNMMIDGGSTSKKNIYENVIKPALSYYGISSLDYVIVTHMDEDHISGIREMYQEDYTVKCLITGKTKDVQINHMENVKKDFLQMVCQKKTQLLFMEEGESFCVKNCQFYCLHPHGQEEYEERNDESLVLVLYYGKYSSLFTGDLGQEMEEKMLAYYKDKVRLLKIGHHGSKYSTGQDLLESLQPDYAMISAGLGNRYGHPHQELLNRLKIHKVKVYGTIYQGAILYESDGRKDRIGYYGNGLF